MKLVVDTNILFSFFKELSLTRSILLSPELELISPEVAISELKKYSEVIEKKSKVNFYSELNNLEKIILFVSKKQYADFLLMAEKISPDPDDAEFFALCIKEKCALWSNDSLLKNQNRINVLSTQDLIEVLF